MEYGMWKDKKICAADMGREYSIEKKIRIASADGELCCQESDCSHKRIRYCHGKIREPYFAHIEKSQCDYAEFEKNRSEDIAKVSNKLYEVLASKDIDVKKEIKLLKHHYSHLVINSESVNLIAVEIIKRNLSVKNTEKLLEEYKNEGVGVIWVEIGDVDAKVKEDKTYFSERFSLNEYNKTLIIIDRDLERVAQYKMDLQEYKNLGKCMYEDKELFCIKGSINELTYTKYSIQFEKFDEKYNEWIRNRRRIFKEKIFDIMDRQKRVEKELEQKRKKELEKQKQLEISRKKFDNKKMADIYEEKSQIYKYENIDKKRMRIDANINYEDLSKILVESETVVTDEMDRRIIKCKYCGMIGYDEIFSSYGGDGQINIGRCKECSRKEHLEMY